MTWVDGWKFNEFIDLVRWRGSRVSFRLREITESRIFELISGKVNVKN